MSFTDLNTHLQDIAKKLDEQMPDIINTQVMQELESEWKDRIFGKGLDTNGVKIGDYSTKPAYYTKEAFIRTTAFKPRGKNGGGDFKNGNKRTSMYMSKGYSELRTTQGRQAEFVNLKYSGSLERAFRVYKFGSEVLFGNASEPEHLKFEGLESKYGDFGTLSADEKEFLKNNITEKATIVAK